MHSENGSYVTELSTCVQLSLVQLNTGMDVLIVGGKGGYINSLVAQVVGFNGSVVTASSNASILDICETRVERRSPLARIMQWRQIDHVSPPDLILEAFQSGKTRFHAVIYCGAIPELPMTMEKLLRDGGFEKGAVVFGARAVDGEEAFAGAIDAGVEGDVLAEGAVGGCPLLRAVEGAEFAARDHGLLI